MYKDRSHIFLGFVIFYVLFSNYGGVLGQNRKEFFPVFKWSLFTNSARNFVVIPDLFIEKLNGDSLAQPVLVKSLRSEFPNVGVGISLRKTIFAYRRALNNKNEKEVERLRNVIERQYLSGPQQVTYSLRHIKYWPLKRIKDGSFETQDTIATYERR